MNLSDHPHHKRNLAPANKDLMKKGEGDVGMPLKIIYFQYAWSYHLSLPLPTFKGLMQSICGTVSM